MEIMLSVFAVVNVINLVHDLLSGGQGPLKTLRDPGPFTGPVEQRSCEDPSLQALIFKGPLGLRPSSGVICILINFHL